MTRIGIYGGSFNPPHIGHVTAACEAHRALALDRLLLMPAATPPHKVGVQFPPVSARLDLCWAAARPHEGIDVSALEFGRSGRSFTVDTLRLLTEQLPGCELTLLVGADQAMTLSRWHEAPELVRLARIAVMPRPGFPHPEGMLDAVTVAGARVTLLDGPQVELSSTLIRARVAAAQPWRHLVPEAVADVIDRLGLYRDAVATAAA